MWCLERQRLKQYVLHPSSNTQTHGNSSAALRASQSRRNDRIWQKTSVNVRTRVCFWWGSRWLKRESLNSLPHCQGHIKGRLRERERGGENEGRRRDWERKKERRDERRKRLPAITQHRSPVFSLSLNPVEHHSGSSAALGAPNDWLLSAARRRRMCPNTERQTDSKIPDLSQLQRKSCSQSQKHEKLLKIYHTG